LMANAGTLSAIVAVALLTTLLSLCVAAICCLDFYAVRRRYNEQPVTFELQWSRRTKTPCPETAEWDPMNRVGRRQRLGHKLEVLFCNELDDASEGRLAVEVMSTTKQRDGVLLHSAISGTRHPHSAQLCQATVGALTSAATTSRVVHDAVISAFGLSRFAESFEFTVSATSGIEEDGIVGVVEE